MTGPRQLAGGWHAELYERDGWQVAHLAPEQDSFGDTQGLGDGLWQLVRDAKPPCLLLDMSRVTFLGSSMMGTLVQVHKRIAIAGGQLHLANLGEHPTEALHACRLHLILPLYATLDDAVK
jgi:anti-anti-sigma factor